MKKLILCIFALISYQVVLAMDLDDAISTGNQNDGNEEWRNADKALLEEITRQSKIEKIQELKKECTANHIIDAAVQENQHIDDPTLKIHESKADRWIHQEGAKLKKSSLSQSEKKELRSSLSASWGELKRMELRTAGDSNAAAGESTTLEKLKAQAKVKVISLLDAGYETLPSQIKMMCQKSAEHPRAAGAISFATAQTCGYFWCPQVFYTVNLFLSGCAAGIAYGECCGKKSKKEKDL